MYKFYRSNFILVLVNFLLTLIFLFFILNQSVKPKSFGDDTFHLEAKAIAEFIKGFRSFDDIQLTKAPGPSIIYSIPYMFIPVDSDETKFWISALIWNLIMVLFSTSIVLVTIFKHINRLVSWVILLFLFAIPLHLYYSLGVLAEPLAFSGICIFIAGTIPLIQSDIIKKRHIFFLTLGLVMFLTARPNGILVFALFPIFFFILFYFFKVPLSKMKGFILGFLLSLFIVLTISFSIQSLPGNQNQELQDNYLFYVMHHGRFQYKTEYFDWRFWDETKRPDSKDYQNWKKSVIDLSNKAKKDSVLLTDIYKEWLIKDAINNPFNIVIQAFIRVLSGNYLQVNSINISKYSFMGFALLLVNLLNIFLNICAIFGFVRLFKENKQWLFIIIPIIALLTFHMLIYMEQRYLYPYRLIVIFLAAYSCVKYLSNTSFFKKLEFKWHH